MPDEDRSKPPEGYYSHRDVHGYYCATIYPMQDTHKNRADAIRDCWDHADRQRAIGAEQERALIVALGGQVSGQIMAAMESSADPGFRYAMEAQANGIREFVAALERGDDTREDPNA